MAMFLIVILCLVVAAVLLVTGFVAANWAPDLAVEDLRARWAPPPSVFLDIGGMKVHLRDEGPRDDASPLVLLHGTGSSLHAWEDWADALKDSRRVIRFDMAGFGLTGPSPDGIYSADNDVRLVIAVLDKLGVAGCVLGGNSLGGAVAWRTALAHPARVDKLILVDAGGYPSHSESVPIGFRLAQLPVISPLLTRTLPRSLVEQGLRNVFGDPRRVTPEMVERAVAMNQREGNRRALVERLRQRAPEARRTADDSLARRIAELKLPTLIVWGGRDRLIPPGDAKRFHRDIAGSVLAVFDDLGHAPEEEDPA
ncbi:MAG: alpha/beta hydrolase, partial [Alphaproteobacteria bacterium]|nr:alpha/beta hydrolase [Alphaproteobacteria bacterium]